MIEQTLVLVKPDGVARGLIGEVIKRFEQRGLKIVALKLVKIDMDKAKKHYTEDITKRRGEKVRNMLLDFITEGPIVAMIIQGVNAIENIRKILSGGLSSDQMDSLTSSEIRPDIVLEEQLQPIDSQFRVEFENSELSKVSFEGRTFSNEFSRSIGKIGEFGHETIWRRQGRIPKFRTIRFTITDPVNANLIKISATPSLGVN